MLLPNHPQIIIQGLTGKEGQKAFSFMRDSGTVVVAGVTPGKGGQTIESIPIFNTVADAITHFPQVVASSIYVPPQFVLPAAQEALESGIKLLHIFAEGVPTQDTTIIIELAQLNQARVIGPSSVGFWEAKKGKLGSIGGATSDQFLKPSPDRPTVAVISKSGGMANEITTQLTQAGIAQSLVIGIGGDRFVGTTYADLLPLVAEDSSTQGLVLIGEIGGSFEEDFAQAISSTQFPKPVVAFVSGLFAQTLPQGVSFGHAGAIVSKKIGTRAGKIAALRGAGAIVVDAPEAIVTHLQQLLVNTKLDSN